MIVEIKSKPALVVLTDGSAFEIITLVLNPKPIWCRLFQGANLNKKTC